ncbi:MAG: prephenate dehydratase domain-containing protein [Eubacteriales bacterium]|nr:prephenate dehydratase domain-containing protein [Eubacteriales bacterium]
MNLDDIRKDIDEVDKGLTQLFVKRMKLAEEVAVYKKENGMRVFDKSRERAVRNKISKLAGEEMADYADVLYNSIFDISRAYQHQIIGSDSRLADKIDKAIEETPKTFPKRAVVACQGVEGSYSQMACDRLFTNPDIVYMNDFAGVFRAVELGLCKYGVLPIENSTAGSVNEVYDLMKKHSFYIVRGIKLKVSHHLLAKKNTKLEDVKEIFSKDIALSQCSEYLSSLSGVKLTVCENTAKAAQMVADSDRNDIAAVSSASCANLYGLRTLNDKIQNSDANYTRFICISKDLEIYPGSDKISMMFSIDHKPGALYNVISRFASLGLNLTKLESRPIPGSDFEFLFYFDINADVHDAQVKKLLLEFDDEFDKFNYLGSYSEVV